MNDSKIIVTKHNNAVVTTLYENMHAKEMFFDMQSDIKVGDIYVGRVESVKREISAAFVTIKEGINGYLPFEEIFPKSLLNRPFDNGLKQGDLVAVSVTQAKLKTKSFRLSMKLSITGKYSIATLDDEKIHYSSKLGKDYISSLQAKIENYPLKTGIIIRTNSSNTDDSKVIEEAVKLSDLLSDISDEMRFRTLYSKLYSASSAFVERIKDINTDLYNEIITDYDDLYEELSCFEKVKLYKDSKLSLKSLYSFQKALSEATERTVMLGCGGYLIIEPTEAFTSIDINSGKFDKKISKEEMIKKVNFESAVEICRQLRLRNLYGIILVDFINMKNEDDQNELISLLKKELKKDSVKANFVDVTKLGIFEITRQKKYPSIYEDLREINN